MLARNVHITEREGKAHISCHGAMVDGGENTPLMHTSYNGGWYGHYVGAQYRTYDPPTGQCTCPTDRKGVSIMATSQPYSLEAVEEMREHAAHLIYLLRHVDLTVTADNQAVLAELLETLHTLDTVLQPKRTSLANAV